jgi:hypothetical protein
LQGIRFQLPVQSEDDPKIWWRHCARCGIAPGRGVTWPNDPFDGLVLPKRGLVETFSFSLEEIRRIVNSASEPTERSTPSSQRPESEAVRFAPFGPATWTWTTPLSTFDRAYGGGRFRR